MYALHRLIVGAQPCDRADHRDNDGLNNRDGNIRLATPQQNRANSRKDRDNQSGYKGVTWAKCSHKWMAQIVYKKHKYYLGVFQHKTRAAIAHDRAALALHWEIARHTPSCQRSLAADLGLPHLDQAGHTIPNPYHGHLGAFQPMTKEG